MPRDRERKPQFKYYIISSRLLWLFSGTDHDVTGRPIHWKLTGFRNRVTSGKENNFGVTSDSRLRTTPAVVRFVDPQDQPLTSDPREIGSKPKIASIGRPRTSTAQGLHGIAECSRVNSLAASRRRLCAALLATCSSAFCFQSGPAPVVFRAHVSSTRHSLSLILARATARSSLGAGVSVWANHVQQGCIQRDARTSRIAFVNSFPCCWSMPSNSLLVTQPTLCLYFRPCTHEPRVKWPLT